MCMMKYRMGLKRLKSFVITLYVICAYQNKWSSKRQTKTFEGKGEKEAYAYFKLFMKF